MRRSQDEIRLSISAETEKKEDADLRDGAEDIYADLYDAQGEQGTLLKSRYAAVRFQCQTTLHAI